MANCQLMDVDVFSLKTKAKEKQNSFNKESMKDLF